MWLHFFFKFKNPQLLVDNDIDGKYLLNIIKVYKPKYIFAPKQNTIFLKKNNTRK